MATAILDKLIQSQWGKSIIMWFFVALAGGNVAQFVDRKRQDIALQDCNSARASDNKRHEDEKTNSTKAHIDDLKLFIDRLEAVEKKRKR